MFTVKIDTGDCTFAINTGEGIAYVLRQLADKVERGELDEGIIPDTYQTTLTNTYGHEIGSAHFEPDDYDED